MEQYNQYGCSDSDRLMSAKFQTHAIELPASARGLRLDQALAAQWPQYSRARIQRWIRAGELTVGGATARPRDAVFGGEQVQLKADFAPDRRVQPQALPLAILYEDSAIIVINKPAGLTVHPGAGQPDGGARVLLTQPDIRRFVRKLIEGELPDVWVVSFAELLPEVALKPVARATPGA